MDGKSIHDSKKFRSEHEILKDIASGAEGKVSLWKNKSAGHLIAVKEPVKDSSSVKESLMTEIDNMKKLGRHPHIVNFLGSSNDWPKVSPAIFYEFCELGDVQQYNFDILNSGSWIPELTLWKFLSDMAKGLDYLHNRLDVPYVHGDLKPNNILVSRPLGDYTGTPLLPTFKIADISRLNTYDRKGRSAYHGYGGTWEYAPPAKERTQRLAPPVDIWALGASMQTLAWGILPVKSYRTMRKELKAAGWPATNEHIRKLRDNEDYRRMGLPFVWRPLNAASADQLLRFDMEMAHPPYSSAVHDWYSMCLNANPDMRITSKILVEHLVLLADAQMGMLVAQKRRDDARRKVKALKAKAKDLRKQKSTLPVAPRVQQGAASCSPAQKPAGKKYPKQADAEEKEGLVQRLPKGRDLLSRTMPKQKSRLLQSMGKVPESFLDFSSDS